MNKIHETREDAVWRTKFWINRAYFYWTRSESKSEAGCICQKIFSRFPISLKHRSAKKKQARSQKSTNGKSGFFLQDIRISLLVFLGVLCSHAFFRVLCSHAQTSTVQSIYISSSSFEKMCNDTSTNVSHQRSARCDESGGKWSGFGFRDFVSRPTYRAPILTYGWPLKKDISPSASTFSGFIPLGPQSRWAHCVATIACEKKLTSFRVQSTGEYLVFWHFIWCATF